MYEYGFKTSVVESHFLFPSAVIFTKKILNTDKQNEPKIYRKIGEYWLHHDFYGAADIKLPNTKLNCDEEVIDFRTGKLNVDSKNSSRLVAPWLLNKTTRSMLYNDYLDPNEFNETTKTGGWYEAPSPQGTIETYVGCMLNPRETRPTRPPNGPPCVSSTFLPSNLIILLIILKPINKQL